MTLEEIRQDLKTVRLYYSDKAGYDAAFQIVPHKRTEETVRLYTDAIGEAPLELYKIYFTLYVDGYTQENAAETLGYCVEYIRQKNKQLIVYLQERLQGGGIR